MSASSGEYQKEPNWYKLHRHHSENPDGAIPEKQKQSNNSQLQLVEIPLLANLGVKHKKSR